MNRDFQVWYDRSLHWGVASAQGLAAGPTLFLASALGLKRGVRFLGGKRGVGSGEDLTHIHPFSMNLTVDIPYIYNICCVTGVNQVVFLPTSGIDLPLCPSRRIPKQFSQVAPPLPDAQCQCPTRGTRPWPWPTWRRGRSSCVWMKASAGSTASTASTSAASAATPVRPPAMCKRWGKNWRHRSSWDGLVIVSYWNLYADGMIVGMVIWSYLNDYLEWLWGDDSD